MVHYGSYIAGTATSGNPLGLGAGTKFYMPFMSTRNMDSIVSWGRTNGYTNFGLYDIHMDARPTKTPALRLHNHLSSVLNTTLPTTPTINVSAGSVSYGNVVVNTISAEKTFSISGFNLTPASGNITMTAPAGFQVSKTSGAGFASSVTCGYSAGVLGTTVMYVRFNPTAIQTYTGNITHSSCGATPQNVAVSGVGVVQAPSVPSGTFSVSPESLPVGGGTVSLTWTSQNATAASLDQGIGAVAVNGSTSVSVSSTKTFTLTLTDGTSSVQYSSTVQVSPSPGGGSDEVIYQDVALASAWSDIRSWSITRNYNSTTQVYEGRTAAQLTHSPWASLQFSKGTWGGFTPIDPAGYESLTFAIHGGSAGVTV